MSSERSYLDGVPLRLSTKFFPIPRMHFKEIDIHIPIDALQEDYDFSLEKSAIAEAKAWEEEKRLRAERKSQERLEREKIEIERLAESILKGETGTSGGEGNSEEVAEAVSSQEEDSLAGGNGELGSEIRGAAVVAVPPPIYNNQCGEAVPIEDDISGGGNVVETASQPVIYSNCSGSGGGAVSQDYVQTYRQDIGGAILQPQPQPLNSDYDSKSVGNERITNKDSDHSYHQLVVPASKINLNLSDFESDTANPFDNVELKSINDMEVLASVLKNSSVTAPTPVPQNQGPSRTVNMNYMNGVTSMGYSEQTPVMYFPSSYPNQNFPSTWASSQYYNPIVPPPISSSSANVTQSLSSNMETPTITQPQISSQSNLPPNSINSFTRFYFPLLTSMANSRANRDRNISPYGGLQPSDVYGCSTGPMSAMGQGVSPGPPIVNQNPISTPAPTMYAQNNVAHRHVASHSPSQLYWPDGHQQIGTNPYANRLSTPYPNETTLSSVNPTTGFQNASTLATAPKGSHPTLH